MSKVTDYEPVITVLTCPWQQIRIKDIHGIDTSTDQEVSSPFAFPVYAVNIVGDNDKVCTFYTQSIEDKANCIARIKEAMQTKKSLDIHPDSEVNGVK